MQNSNYKIIQKFKVFLEAYIKECFDTSQFNMENLIKEGGVEEALSLFEGIFKQYIDFLNKRQNDSKCLISCTIKFEEERIKESVN